MEVSRVKALIGILVLYLLEECQAIYNSSLNRTSTRQGDVNVNALASHDLDDSMQKALKDHYISKRPDVVVLFQHPNEVMNINLTTEEALKITSKREPLQTEPKTDNLTLKISGLRPAPAKRHKRSMFINKPIFERFVIGKGPFAKSQEKFSDASHMRDLHILKQERIEKEIERREKNKDFTQPLLERKHIFSNYVIPVYETNVKSFVRWWMPETTTISPLKILYEGPIVTSRKPVSRPTVQESVPSSSNTLPKVQAPKQIKEANKNRYRRSLIWNPKFEAVFDLKRQYQLFQQKFFRASDHAKETWGKRITNKSAALPQVEKSGNRGNIERVKEEFPFKKLQLPKFAISQFFKPSFSYAGPIPPYAKCIIPSSSMAFTLPTSTLVDALSALKVPFPKRTSKFHSENSHHVQDTPVKLEQVKLKNSNAFGLVSSKLNTEVNFSRFVPFSLDKTSKLPWNKIPISSWGYQYVLGSSGTHSNFSLSTITKAKDQSFWKTNSHPDLQSTQNILNYTKDFPDSSLPKPYISHYFQFSLEPSKTHKNNSKGSELVLAKPNDSSENLPNTQRLNSLKDFPDLSLLKSQAEFGQKTTTNKPTWNIQSVQEPAGSQKISSNGSELNVLKDFSSLRLPSFYSQLQYSYKNTSTPSRSLLKPSEVHKDYSGFLSLILPKTDKLSLFRSKPAILSMAGVSNVISSIDAQSIQPSSLKFSTNISKSTHSPPKSSEITIETEVSNSTIPLLSKVKSAMQFSSPVLPSKYSSGLSLPRSHDNFSSEIPYRPKWNFQHVVEISKVLKISSDATKINASKFDTLQQSLSIPKVSRHHQFVVEPSNVPLVPLDVSQISDSKSTAGTVPEGLSASVSSSQFHNSMKFRKNQNIHSDVPKVFASNIKANRSHFEFSRLHVPKANLIRPFKSISEPTHSPRNINKLLNRSEFQPIKPSSTESSTKPPEIIYDSTKPSLTSLPHMPIDNQKDPERSARDILLPQLFKDPTQFVNSTSTLRPVVSKNLSESSSSHRTLPSTASNLWSSTIEQPSSTHKAPFSKLSKALQQNIWYTSQFVPGESKNISKLEHEITTLKILTMEPEVNAFLRVPLPNIIKYHSFHLEQEAPTISSHTEPEKKEIVMKSDLEQGHIETGRSSNLAALTLKNTTKTFSYGLPSVATRVTFREPSTLVEKEFLTLDQSASVFLKPTTPLFSRKVPNVRKTHIFRRVSKLPNIEEKSQRDTTSNPTNLVISQIRNQTLVSSSELSTAVAKIDSQQPQQISVAPIRKQDDNNKLDKESNMTLTHIKHVKRRRIKPGTRTRTLLQNHNDQPSIVNKLRLVKDGSVVKVRESLSSKHVMSSTKSKDVISSPMPSHLVPSINNSTSLRRNESSLNFKEISHSDRSDIPVELEAFPVRRRKNSNDKELYSPGFSDVLQKEGLAVISSSERVINKENLVVTLLKKEKLSQNIPENAVVADVEIS